MKILIDTHIFLWFLNGIRLSQKVENLLEDTLSNEIFVSYATAWEISIKYGTGKLKLPEVPEIFVPDRIRRAGFLHLPIEIQHVLRVHNLPPIHRDPFDRLMISQASVENLTILTADPDFAKYEVKLLNLNKL